MKLLPALKYILIIFLFSGMACEKTVPEPTFIIGKESEFRIHQLYNSSDGKCTLLITEIADSRCPEGAMCIWQGELSLKGEWTESNTKTSIEIHSVLKDLQKQPAGITIQIVDAKPTPKVGIESKPNDLVITLLIKRN